MVWKARWQFNDWLRHMWRGKCHPKCGWMETSHRQVFHEWHGTIINVRTPTQHHPVHNIFAESGCHHLHSLRIAAENPSDHKSWKEVAILSYRTYLCRMRGSCCNCSEPYANWTWRCLISATSDYVRRARRAPDRNKVNARRPFFLPGDLCDLVMRCRRAEAHCVAWNTIKIINGQGNAIKESAPCEHGAG